MTARNRSRRNNSARRVPLSPFLELSRVLTGQRTLDPSLAAAYRKRALEHLGTKLAALLNRFIALKTSGRDLIEAVRTEILLDVDLGPSARLILKLWYTGGIKPTPDGDWEMQSAEQYYRALVWDAIGAHPPTLSNGYFGHWKYPAEL